MTVYIVREENQLKIIKVKPELEDDFQADYAGKILLSGDKHPGGADPVRRAARSRQASR